MVHFHTVKHIHLLPPRRDYLFVYLYRSKNDLRQLPFTDTKTAAVDIQAIVHGQIMRNHVDGHPVLYIRYDDWGTLASRVDTPYIVLCMPNMPTPEKDRALFQIADRLSDETHVYVYCTKIQELHIADIIHRIRASALISASYHDAVNRYDNNPGAPYILLQGTPETESLIQGVLWYMTTTQKRINLVSSPCTTSSIALTVNLALSSPDTPSNGLAATYQTSRQECMKAVQHSSKKVGVKVWPSSSRVIIPAATVDFMIHVHTDHGTFSRLLIDLLVSYRKASTLRDLLLS